MTTTARQPAPSPAPEIRRARPEERDAIARLLGEAFMDDPVSRWVFPGEAHRRAVHPRFFGAFLDAALREGWVDVTNDLSAAALWLPVHPAAEGGEVEDGDEVAEAIAAADPGNERTGIVGRLTAELHPHDRAHYFLPMIAASPAHQGRGLGAALLTAALDRCDREGMPAYLEASNERSKALYERLGFTFLGTTVDLPNGPHMWPMWRDPHN
ncbi:GNAT family N-acetyltransferase [Streptomyces pathocidini]|uniref:GNAT family N-acetyltransferase n=1 Tax=Streptomyces pathocidini TaxID=1650571 RepID=A0ABW7UQA1_9ACTN|nr:GNAT family N-acetyltransferase [Streptomyces pathocidini]